MAYCLDTYIDCEAVQEPLNGYFTNFDPTANRDSNTFLKFLSSPENKQGIKIGDLIDPGNGRKKMVKLLYMPRFPEHEAGSDPCDTCQTGEPFGELSTTYDLDCVGTSWTRSIALDSLERNCKSDEFFYVNLLNRGIDVMMRRANSIAISEAAALLGGAFTTSTKNAAGAFVNTAVEDIQYQIRAMGELGSDVPVVIVGEDLILKYSWASEFACCNDQAVDWGRYFTNGNLVMVQDMKIENGSVDAGTSGLGANHFLATVPGALQLLTFNKFRGSQWAAGKNIGTTLEKGIVVDGVYNIPLDYRVSVTCANGNDVVNLYLGFEHQLVGMPTDLFCAGDIQEGQVYTWDVTVTNP